MSNLVHISNDSLTADVDSMGAQLMSLTLDGSEYLWQGDARIWPRRAPVLFPIVGCLRNDHATSKAGDIHLKRHGIARLYDHKVVKASASSVTFELVSNEQTREAFPYDFTLNMSYAIADGALTQTFLVTNTGNCELPFTLGGHPAFNVPAPNAEEDESFSDYEIVFDEPWCISTPAISEEGIHDFDSVTVLAEHSRHLHLSHELFEKLLTITLYDVPGRHVRLLGPSGHGIEMSFEGFDYLGLWTASADAPFVAVEPWCGCATAKDESDVFEEKRGIITLEPGESCERAFSMRPL